MYFLHHFVMTTIVVFIISHTAHSGEEGPKTDKEENTAAIGNCKKSLTNIGFTGKLQHDKDHKLNFEMMAGFYVPGYIIIMSHFVITKNGEEETITKKEENAADIGEEETKTKKEDSVPDIDWSKEGGLQDYCKSFHKKEYSSEECHAKLESYALDGKIYHDSKRVNELGDKFLDNNDYRFSYQNVLIYIRAMFNAKGKDEDQDKIIKQTHENFKKLNIIIFVCDGRVEYRDKAEEGNFPDEIEVKKAAVGEEAKTV